MTAPDHRPYLIATDLRTAEDAAEWLREWRSTATDRELIAAVDWVHAYDVQDLRNAHELAQELAYMALRSRLDRERRQACRRGCFAMFREACRERTRERRPPVQPPRYGGWSLASGVYREHRLHYLRRALAFRAAARQP